MDSRDVEMNSPEIDVEEMMRGVQHLSKASDSGPGPQDVRGTTDLTQVAPLSSLFPPLHAAVGQAANTPDTFAAARLALSQRRLGVLVRPFLARLVNFFARWQVQWNLAVAQALEQVLKSLEHTERWVHSLVMARDRRMDGIEESLRGLQSHVEIQVQNLQERIQETDAGQGELRRQAGLLEVRWKTLEERQRQDEALREQLLTRLQQELEQRDERLQDLQERIQETDAGQGELRQQAGLLEVRWKTLEERQRQEEALREQLSARLQHELEERQRQEEALREQLSARLQQELEQRDERLAREQQERERLQQVLEERQRQEEALREQLLARLQQELEQRDGRLTREREERERLQHELGGLLQRHVELFHHYEELRQENLLQKRRLDLILTELRQKAGLDEPSARTLAAQGERLLDHTYFLFENRFRGTQEEIRKRQEIYLPVFQDALPPGSPLLRDNGFVLDLGCGRGEMLEVLREADIAAGGVDINEDMVLVCRQKGLEVMREDLFVYLRSLADESLAGAISCQVIEHLTVEQNIELLRLLYDKLRWGARLVLETVNPENLLVSACNFYADLSHRLKIPAMSLAFLAEALGFTVVETRYLSPFPLEHHFRLPDRDGGDPHLQLVSENFHRLNGFFFGPQDYALICCKGRAESS